MTSNVIDDPMLDEEWLAAPVKRSRLRAVLVVLLAGSLCFLGGALVQRQFGDSSGSTSATGPAGFGGGQLPDGLAEGGFPALGGSDPATDSAAGADETDSVIGTLVEVRGDVWIVEDLGGKRHRVVVGDDTDVVRETRTDVTSVKAGDPVDISGTTDSGRLQADEVTLR